jgi:tetratricopeptide (TPR) repeat protein
MNSSLRRADFLAVTLMTAATILLPACMQSFSQDQPTPTTEPQTDGPAHPRDLNMEQRADIFMARKNYADAADYYVRALRQSSYKDPVLWNKLGIAFQQEDKFRNARQAYNKSFHVDPNFAEGWNNMGTVYFMEAKYSKSVTYYERAIKLKDDSAAFHLNLGTAYYHLKKFDLAVQEYRTALGLDPKIAVRQSALGTTIHAGGADPAFYFYMAKAYASIGDAENAVRYLKRALEDGYASAQQLGEDPDFKKVSQDPAYVELIRNPPVALKN